MSNKKFYYHVEETWSLPSVTVLDRWGNEGWEIVAILREKHTGMGHLYTSYFKKEV
jgi:hypothetical protein